MNGGESRAINSAFETINAAANAIASAENRVPQATIPKRRWGSCWNIYWCFGSPNHRKRIGHAVLVPETSAHRTTAPTSENPTQASTVTIHPFAAPPSSPASFLLSEPPSSMQSPAGGVSLASISASMYSPSGPASIFAIGPYAHELQLVSPPVFSTFTTEPSTAPFTPPPESVHLTTPSSPEVPFARLLDPSLRNGEAGQRLFLSQYDFYPYQFQPGSPIGQLISPSSGISGSGTSSPFPDTEFSAGRPVFPQFRIEPPKILNLDKRSSSEYGSYQGSGTLTPEAGRATTPPSSFLLERQVSSRQYSEDGLRNNQTVGHRVSFELTTENFVRCVEKKSTPLALAVSKSLQNGSATEREDRAIELSNGSDDDTPEKDPSKGEDAPRHQKHRSTTLGSIKEFNFDQVDGGEISKATIGTDWWANEKVVGNEGSPPQNWSFFPMLQPVASWNVLCGAHGYMKAVFEPFMARERQGACRNGFSISDYW
ncbi:hypothetical protein ACFE04_012683 [Oxalis oulophora]